MPPLTKLQQPSSGVGPHQRLLGIRRQNVLLLRQEYQERVVAAGGSVKGTESAFAKHLLIHPTMWSQIKGARPITDFLARKIEAQCGRPVGWLDTGRGASAAAVAAEDRFVELARKLWRAESSRGKRELLTLLVERECELHPEDAQETVDAVVGSKKRESS